MVDVHLDYEAIGKILRETVAGPISTIALRVAAEARTDPNTPESASVTVKQLQTDRAIAVVRLEHPASAALQAKYGILTRAAASVGLEVKAK